MNKSHVRQRYERPEPPPEKTRKLELSAEEVIGLAKRDVHCPKCNFIVDRVYSDAVGHKDIKCQKCKFEGPINLAYFRRQKGIWKLKRKYYEP